MSRSSARECLAPGTVVAPGEVLVATEIGDPAHGLLTCPAAPLVGGLLYRRGVRVRYAPVPQSGDASQADDGAALFVTTALHSDGTATAIGAAASSVDGVAMAAARGAVEEWAAVGGTRRLLSAVQPVVPGRAAGPRGHPAGPGPGPGIRVRAAHGEPAGLRGPGEERRGLRPFPG